MMTRDQLQIALAWIIGILLSLVVWSSIVQLTIETIT